MFRRILIIIAVASTLAGALFAHPPARRARAHAFAECVQISAEQRDAIRSLREQEREAARPTREELRGAAVEFKRLSDQNDPKAKAQLTRVRDLRDELAARRLAMRAQMEALLTAEQRQNLEACREERAMGRRGASR